VLILTQNFRNAAFRVKIPPGWRRYVIVRKCLDYVSFGLINANLYRRNLKTMFPHELPHILPQPPVSAEILKEYKITREFYQEVAYRQDFERYCEWYYSTAKQHQQELEKMQGDFNILGWFRRGK
jgi:hypothetical protein